jgi:sporulation protein YlmC with PRC-barrel domain
MAHYGMLRDYRFSDDVDDVRGASLYGINDEKLGKIDDVIFDHASGDIRYAVVDSGGWLSSKKFLVPADRIRPYAKDEDDFSIDMTKQQIEALPRYDEDSFKKDKDDNERAWSDYDERYHKSLETTGDVMHREGSTHAITPDPSELPATGRALADEDSLQPERVAGVFTDTAPNPNKTRMRPSGIAARAEDSAVVGQSVPEEMPTRLEEEGLDRKSPMGTGRAQSYDADRNGRLSAFEDHLRRNRVDITSSCRSCDVKKDRVA